MKDFLQTLLGIIMVGAVMMALILYFFPNPEALGMGGETVRETTQEEEPAPARADTNTTSFADELLPAPQEPPVYVPLADELLTGEAYNRPKPAAPYMFEEAMTTVSASGGRYVAPSRIVVQKGDGEAYVWCEFEYAPDGAWMKQRIFPLKEGENAVEILYNGYGSIQKAGIGRKQLISYDRGFPLEGIGLGRDGEYRYFKRADNTIEYDTDQLFFVSHADEPLYRIECLEDLVRHVREEKYYEQRISGGEPYIFQHRVIDDRDLVRRIVDFSKHDNEEPLLKAIREYDERERLVSHRTYDADKNVTQEESFSYDADGFLKEHTRYTSINGIAVTDEETTAEAVNVMLTSGLPLTTPVRYADYFDRPDAETVRRLTVNEQTGNREEATYHLTRDREGRVTGILSECGDRTRTEQWTYDGNGNWISYRVLNGETVAFQMDVSYRETAYPYDGNVMQRRILSLEPLRFAAFLEDPVKDAFWWCSPDCAVEERFVLSGLYY